MIYVRESVFVFRRIGVFVESSADEITVAQGSLMAGQYRFAQIISRNTYATRYP
jgi:uncharacterized membrane protein YoaK (UPF0700 family)